MQFILGKMPNLSSRVKFTLDAEFDINGKPSNSILRDNSIEAKIY